MSYTNVSLYFAVPILHDFVRSPESGRLCRELAESGYAGVEPLVDGEFPLNPREVRDYLGTRGLGISALRTGGIYERYGLYLSDANPSGREQAVLRLKETIRYAQAVACPRVAVGLMQGHLAPGDSGESARARVGQAISECASYAMSYGVEIDLEPLNRNHLEYNNTAEEVASLLSQVGNPNACILLDTFQMSVEERSVAATLLAYAPLMGYLHLSDTDRKCPGEGELDFGELFEVLGRAGFRGPVTIECDVGANPGLTAAKAARFLASIGVVAGGGRDTN